MSTLQTTNLKHPDSASNNIQFDSSGNISVEGNLQFEADDGITIGAKESLSVNLNSSGGQSSRVFQVRDNGTVRFTVEQEGNCGIGTTSLNHKLSLNSSEAGTRIFMQANSGGSPERRATVGVDADGLKFQTRNGSFGSLVDRVTVNNSGTATFKKLGDTDAPNINVTSGGAGDPSTEDPRIEFSASGLESVGTSGIRSTGAYNARALAFYTGTDTNGTEAVRIDHLGRLLCGGITSGNGRASLHSGGPVRIQNIYFAHHARTYTPSTSATALFGIQMAGGHGFADLTWAFVDSSYPNGVRMGKIFLTFRGSGSNITAVTINASTENSITNGTVSTISWTASVADVNHVRLTATGSTESGAGTMHLYGTSNSFNTLTPIKDA